MSEPDGGLPEGWSEARLGDVGQWFGGGTPSKQKASYWTDGTIPWVSPKDMKSIELAGAIDHITEQAVQESSAKLVPEGSVALVTRSGILQHTLPVALVPFAAAFNQDIRVVSPRSDIDARWLLYALLGLAEEIRRSCQKDGTTVASINTGRLMAVPLSVPPREQQERIVALIEASLSQVNAGVASFVSAARRVELYERSVLQDALGDCATPTNGGGGGLAELPGTWEWSTVAEEGAVQLGRMLNNERSSGPHMRPYLRVANVLDDRLDLTDVKEMDFPPGEYERYLLHPGDILLNEGQSPELLGRAAMYRGESPGLCFQKTLLRFQAGPRAIPEFALLVFRHYLYSGRFRRESRITTGIGHLTQVRFAAMEFPVPPLVEQERIVRDVRQQLDSADRLRAVLGKTDEDAARLRTSVLKSGVLWSAAA